MSITTNARIMPLVPARVDVTNTGEGPAIIVCWLQPSGAVPNPPISSVVLANQQFSHTFQTPSAADAVFLGVDIDTAEPGGSARLQVSQAGSTVVDEAIDRDRSFKFPISM